MQMWISKQPSSVLSFSLYAIVPFIYPCCHTAHLFWRNTGPAVAVTHPSFHPVCLSLLLLCSFSETPSLILWVYVVHFRCSVSESPSSKLESLTVSSHSSCVLSFQIFMGKRKTCAAATCILSDVFYLFFMLMFCSHILSFYYCFFPIFSSPFPPY